VKISNETKVGAVAVVSVAFLILGFNFLKGKKLLTKSTTLYANYGNVQGLQKSNPVMINGMQVGNVYDIRTDKSMRNILVELTITKDVLIPANSIAIIKTNPIGTPSLEIKLGDAGTNLKSKDSILTEASGGLFDNVLKNVDPVLFEVKRSIKSLDTLLVNFNELIDTKAKKNIGATLENLNTITASMIQSTASLNILLNAQSGVLAKSLNNVNSITANFASNNEKINSVVSNLDKTTTKFAALEFDKTLNTLNATLADLKTTVAKMNSTDGTMGKLLNDPVMYNNLASTGNKLNLLLDDIRINPKRYVNISVFGKKTKGNALMTPLPDTLNAPYYIEKVKIN
jgi:phospholipid/cholesterol/gamma-HCH transport system substrate-binding protein